MCHQVIQYSEIPDAPCTTMFLNNGDPLDREKDMNRQSIQTSTWHHLRGCHIKSNE